MTQYSVEVCVFSAWLGRSSTTWHTAKEIQERLTPQAPFLRTSEEKLLLIQQAPVRQTHQGKGQLVYPSLYKLFFLLFFFIPLLALRDHCIGEIFACLTDGATHSGTVSMSAFLACHQCYCAGSSLAWGLNLWAVVCGIF